MKIPILISEDIFQFSLEFKFPPKLGKPMIQIKKEKCHPLTRYIIPKSEKKIISL
jgi:hypothetical protein